MGIYIMNLCSSGIHMLINSKLNCRNSRPRSSVFVRISESERELWEDIYTIGTDKKYIALPYIEFELIETHLRYSEEKKDQLISQQVVGNFADLIFQDPNSKDYINESDMEF